MRSAVFWKKKKLQWTSSAGVYPSRKIVEKFPELGDLKNNPHFRMCVASPKLEQPWNSFVAVGLIVMLLSTKPILQFLWDQPIFLEFLAPYGCFAAFFGFLIATEANPLFADTPGQHVYPEKDLRCVDYFVVGIKSLEIVPAIAGLELREERLRALWEITVIGFFGSAVSMLLDPRTEVIVSRSLIIYACCFRLGARFWPVGIAARGALAHAKKIKLKIYRTQNPFRYWAKNIIPLLLAGLLVSACIVLLMIGLDYSSSEYPEMFPKDFAGWMLFNLMMASGLTVLGLMYARYCQKLRKYYLRKAEEVVAEILEMKREEILGLKPAFME